MFRKALIKLRKWYRVDRTRLLAISIFVFGVSLALSICADMWMPFRLWFNVVRSIILIPLSLSIFVIGYSISLFLHYQRVEEDPDWIPYRLRFSVLWRRRFALIVSAILVVLAYAVGYKIGYTLVSSIIVAIGISLFAFIRTTNEEKTREYLDIPDIRDTRYQNDMKRREEARMKKEQDKNSRRRLLRRDNSNGE